MTSQYNKIRLDQGFPTAVLSRHVKYLWQQTFKHDSIVQKTHTSSYMFAWNIYAAKESVTRTLPKYTSYTVKLYWFFANINTINQQVN